MVPGKSPEWLPLGFTEKIKYKDGRKIKYYVNDATGAKYHSKKDVISSATTEIVSNVLSQITNEVNTTNDDDQEPPSLPSDNKVEITSAKANDSLDELPNGWTVEEKIKNSSTGKGSKYKVYIDSSSGKKFYSKAAVARYLNSRDHVNTTTVQHKLDTVTLPEEVPQTNADSTPEKGATMSPSADGLPPGWIKETRTCKSGDKTKHYPVYIDSSSGKKFSSRAAVVRHLNSVESANTTPVQNELDIVTLPEVPQPQTNANHAPETEEKESSPITAVTMSSSVDGLPPGWIKEMKTCKSGYKTRHYPVYIDSSSGTKFSSRAAVVRYLNSVEHANSTPLHNKLDSVDEPIPDISPPMTNASPIPEKKRKESSPNKLTTLSTSADELPPGWIKETKITKSGNKRRKIPIYVNTSSGTKVFSRVAVDRYENSADHAYTTTAQNEIDNVDEPLPHMSQQLPVTDASPVIEKKQKESSYKMVATVSSPADGLPPGWIKEIRTSQSGDKIRTEPYYTDPVSGYEFRSKPDALRFLKNGDIRYCRQRPKKKELGDPMLTENEVPVSVPVSIPVSEQANQDLQELTSKCIYWQNQAHSLGEQAKALQVALEVQQATHNDHLKKAKEKEARLVATLEASLTREEEKSNQLEPAEKELKAVKMELEIRSRQLEITQRELEEKNSQLETAQKELQGMKMELEGRSRQLEITQRELEEKNNQLETAQKEFTAIKMELELRSRQFETAQKELKAMKMELEVKSRQLKITQGELEGKNSQLETAQKELEERRNETSALREELFRENEKVHELERANCPTSMVGMGGAPKGFDINRFDPFRVDRPGNAFANKASSTNTTAPPNPQEDDFASLFGNDDDRGQGQGQPRWPRFF